MSGSHPTRLHDQRAQSQGNAVRRTQRQIGEAVGQLSGVNDANALAVKRLVKAARRNNLIEPILPTQLALSKTVRSVDLLPLAPVGSLSSNQLDVNESLVVRNGSYNDNSLVALLLNHQDTNQRPVEDVHVDGQCNVLFVPASDTPTVSCGSQSLLRIDSAVEMRSLDALDQNGCINIHKIREVIGGWVNNGRDWLYETLSARETSRNAFRIIRNTFSSK